MWFCASGRASNGSRHDDIGVLGVMIDDAGGLMGLAFMSTVMDTACSRL